VDLKPYDREADARRAASTLQPWTFVVAALRDAPDLAELALTTEPALSR